VRLNAAERRRPAVADLHEARCAAALDVRGRRDGDPILDGRVGCHGAAGAKTRRRWPSGSRATKVKPKSMAVGGWAILSLRRLQSACAVRTASASDTVMASSAPPGAAVTAGATLSRKGDAGEGLESDRAGVARATRDRSLRGASSYRRPLPIVVSTFDLDQRGRTGHMPICEFRRRSEAENALRRSARRMTGRRRIR
jgi:hypothetical protein